MTIRARTWLLVGSVALVLAIALVGTSRAVISQNFDRLERSFAERAMRRSLEAMQSALGKLGASTGDYAWWDDTFDYMRARSADYESTNFLASSLLNIGVNCALFYDTTGRAVRSLCFYTADDTAESPIPPGLGVAIEALPRLLHQPDSSSGMQGIVMAGTLPVMVAASPILRNDRAGHSNGTLVFAATLDSTQLQRLSVLAGVPLRLHVLAAAGSAVPGPVVESLRAGAPWVMRVEQPDTLTAYALVRDMQGTPVLAISAHLDREIHRRGRITQIYAVGWALGVTLILSLLFLLVLERNILARLRWLRRGIDNIKRIALPSARLAQSARDEIGQVALDINGMLEGIEHARRELTASEERYQTLFSRMLGGFALHEIVLDGQGAAVDYRFLDVNPAFERMTGLRGQDIIGKCAREVLPGLEPLWVERYGAVALSGEPAHFEAYAGPLGKHFEVLAFRPAPGQFAATFTDITGRKHAEVEQERMQTQLAQAQKMEAIGQLAGGIAHDFNNQLSGVLGYADMLKEKVAADATLSRYAGNMIVGIRRAADLTAQLLAFARKGKYLSVPVDMHAVVVEVVSLLEHTLDKRIAIRQRLAARPPTTLGDPTQLQNVVLNLALNARDAMPQGGELTFATEVLDLDEEYCRVSRAGLTPGRYLQLSVSDTGVGMDADTMKHVFEPFFTTKARGKGTGMGLAAAYGTVHNHHGGITVYSEPGRGSALKVYLPVCVVEQQYTEEPAAPVPRLPGTPHVLLVDDEDMVRSMGADMLADLGCRVSVAAGGREAVELFRRDWSGIDLVLLDMVMPDIDGRDTFAQMQAINPKVRAILASGYSLNGEAQKLIEAGVLDFVQKPFRKVELARALLRALAMGSDVRP